MSTAGLVFGQFQFNTSNGFAGINVSSAPSSALQVYGSEAFTANTYSSSVTVGNYDRTVLCNPGAAMTVTLPYPSTCIYRIYVIKDISNNASTYNITISSQSGNIEGSSTYTISTNHGKVTVQNDGINWWIIGT